MADEKKTTADIRSIVDLFRSAKIDLSTEKRAQADMERVLQAAGVSFEREVRLTSLDIVDFMIGGVAIELKLRGARKKSIYRQLSRYCTHQRVEALVLASNLSMGMPSQILGKDVYVVRLGEVWV